MSDIVGKAKDAVSGIVDKVMGSDVDEKIEDEVEEQAAKGGTLGSVADKADDAIDSIQGTKD